MIDPQDEIAQTLVYILQVCGNAKDFLCDIVMAEVLSTGELLERGGNVSREGRGCKE